MDTGALVSRAVNFNPTSLITAADGRWTSETYTYVFIYVFVFILCFILSINNYPYDDPTPYIHRILYAITSGLWNIAYLIYYIFFRF
jgi:hypothetical protein